MTQVNSITYSQLVPQLISNNDWNNWIKRGKIVRLRKGGYGHEALVSFDSLPTDLQKKVIVLYPEYSKQEEPYNIGKYMDIDGDAVRYFANYTKDGKGLSPALQEEYVNNCNVLNAALKMIEDRKSFIQARQGSTKAVQAQVLSHIIKMQDVLAHTLPLHPDRLRKKLNEYKEVKYACMVSKLLGNSNRAKMKEEAAKKFIESIISLPQNYNNEDVAKLYNDMAKIQGWPIIEAANVQYYRKQVAIYTDLFRRGAKQMRDNQLQQVKRSAPSSAMLYWTVDGWDAELLYQADSKNSKGQKVTTYHNRLTVVVVLDAATKYPIGYSIGLVENTDVIKAALRNALCHSMELFGGYYYPYQIQSDNFGKKTLESTYAAISKVFSPARVGNGKSKVIEPYFLHLNNHYAKFENNWSGYGVTAKKENQPNQEWLQNNRHNFPDINGCRKQIESIIERERAAKREEYLASWQQTPEDRKQKLTLEEFLYHFGSVTGKTIKLTGPGITPVLLGSKRAYDTFDRKFRELSYINWKIKFNPEDLQYVLAESECGLYKFILQEKYVQPMALADRKEGDAEALKALNDFNQQLVQAAIDRGEQNFAHARNLIQEAQASDPKQVETLSKLLLTDSKGQHKSNKKRQPALEPMSIDLYQKPIQRADLEDDDEIDAAEWIKNRM